MSGSGNLLLKRGTAIPSGNTSTPTLQKGMPAAQIQGISESTNQGLAQYNYENRFWMGCNTYGRNTTTGGIGTAEEDNTELYPFSGNPIDYGNVKRPLWMGAEIRAFVPVKFAQGDTYYTILKADWTAPSDVIIPTQKAIYEFVTDYVDNSGGGGDPVLYDINDTDKNGNTVTLGLSTGNVDGALYSGGKILIPDPNGDINFNAAALNYILKVVGLQGDSNNNTIVTLGWSSLTANFNEYLSATSGASVALLGSDGATKGPQTFLSPINIEQKLTVNGYTVDYISYPATIYSDNTEASIFDENITTLSIGGSASTITLGDASTSGSTITTIYGSTIINGSLQATEIDGGSF